MFSSPLRRAIDRGMKPGGNLANELSNLGDYSIESRKDAKAICAALEKLPLKESKDQLRSTLFALAALFQDVAGVEVPAFKVMYQEGLPQLIRIFDASLPDVDEEGADELLMVLKILAMYGSKEGAEKVVEAARRPLAPTDFMWHVVLAAFSDGHPCQAYLFGELSNPLPPAFIGVSLLDSANEAAIKGELERHPFDNPAGWERLQNWLTDAEPERFSYAHSATASLPFLSNPPRDRLLALAMDHMDVSVQIEAAWAAGKVGSEAGLKILSRYCLEINHSDVAQRYLTELEREDLIPDAAREPSFQAQADFAHWLAHPNELGRAPDALEIVDHRQLAWPPEREDKPFWLIRFRAHDPNGLDEDQINCGLVGSMTWCFFTNDMPQRPLGDIYAIHCCWEMENQDLIKNAEVTDAGEYAGLLAQWSGSPLQAARIMNVSELSPTLKAPKLLVAVATARLDSQEGWVVLDGPRSAWYLKSEQPNGTSDSTILRIHIGRQLLNLHDAPDRSKLLTVERPRRDPQQFVAAFDKLLAEAETAKPERQKDLLDTFGVLTRHLETYLDSLATVTGKAKSEVILDVYPRLSQLAAQTDESVRDELHDANTLLGSAFDPYVDALVAHGRSAEIPALVDRFAPCWTHNLGYGRLGTAAFKAGERDVAEQYFLRLRGGLDDYCRCEEMSMLAEIWHARGETQQAGELLIDCLQKLIEMIRASQYNSDRAMFAGEFQDHRSTFLRLIPHGEQELARLGIPVDPLKSEN